MTETELEYQFCFNCNDRKNCYTKPKDCTRIKEEIGLQDMTNEEWFCQLTTEEKAEWLTNSGFLTCTLRDCEDCKYYDKNNDDCIDGYEATHDKQMWVEWLKQPHHSKE